MATLDLTNHFLIAMPALMDPNFHQTVTYICAHNADGAMGIVINRPMGIVLSEVLEQMDLTPEDPRVGDIVVYQGGPVQRDRGFIIYRPPSIWESTIKVTDTLGLATSRDILEAMCRGEGPLDSLIALGYAGWGAGQLEQELADNAWLSTPADEQILFHVPSDQRYSQAAARLGINIAALSSQVGHA